MDAGQSAGLEVKNNFNKNLFYKPDFDWQSGLFLSIVLAKLLVHQFSESFVTVPEALFIHITNDFVLV